MAQGRGPRTDPVAKHGRQHDVAAPGCPGDDRAHDQGYQADADQRQHDEQRQILLAEHELREAHAVPIGTGALHEARDGGKHSHAWPRQDATEPTSARHRTTGQVCFSASELASGPAALTALSSAPSSSGARPKREAVSASSPSRTS